MGEMLGVTLGFGLNSLLDGYPFCMHDVIAEELNLIKHTDIGQGLSCMS